MSFDAILAIATIFGGIAAVWFFWDKIAACWGEDDLRNPSRENIVKVVLKSDAKTDWVKKHAPSKEVVSYIHNPNLRFEMSQLEDGVQCQDFRESWANRHPDPKAVGLWCDLYFGSTLIDRFILVGVDGVRALVPPPRDAGGMPGGVKIQPLDYKVARIHDTLGTLDEYLRRSGLQVARRAV